MMNLFLLLCTLVAALVMLPSATPCFALLPQKVRSFVALDNTRSSFFFPSRISILNLVYLRYFRFSICDFRFCSINMSLLSNATGLIQFGFFKRELCPISHSALIMDCFNIANLYRMPRVIVSSFGYEIDREKTTVCALSTTFYIIPIQYLERDL